MSDNSPGEPGESGKPGSSPPDNKGGDGGAGGTGGVGLPGVPGLPGVAGRRGEHGDTGRAGRDGRNSISLISNGVSRLWAVAATLFLAVVVLALVVTLTSQARDKRTIDGLNGQVAGLNEQITALNDKADVIEAGRANEQIIEGCRNLYQEDIEFAQIARDIEEGRLFATVVAIPRTAPEAEYDEIVRQAVADLNAKDEVLREVSLAFRRYVALYWPPIDCPHPESP